MLLLLHQHYSLNRHFAILLKKEETEFSHIVVPCLEVRVFVSLRVLAFSLKLSSLHIPEGAQEIGEGLIEELRQSSATH